jgi:hypothetical protein
MAGGMIMMAFLLRKSDVSVPSAVGFTIASTVYFKDYMCRTNHV